MLVEPYLTDLTCYDRLESFVLEAVGEVPRNFRVVRVRRADERLLVQLEGIDSITAARALVGCECYVKRADLPAPGEGEYYWFDLEGLVVRTEAGDYLGLVEEFFHTGSNAVLVVRKDSQETLLPFIKDVILHVDSTEGILRIRVIPGLL